MNFYKSIFDTANDNLDCVATATETANDHFKDIRLLVNKIKTDSNKESRDLGKRVCLPSLIHFTMENILKKYSKQIKERKWCYEKVHNLKAVSDIIEKILVSNNEEMWPNILQGSVMLRDFNYITIISAIEKIIQNSSYLSQIYPEDYCKIIMFILNLDVTSHKLLLKHLCFDLKWKILFSKNDMNLRIQEIVLLTKFYAIIYTLQRDIPTLMDMMYDSLYYLKNRAHAVIYTILSVWPEIFPLCVKHDCMLIYTIAFVILNHKLENNKPWFLTEPLKNILVKNYYYRRGRKTAEHMLLAIMQDMKNSGWLKWIILLCKRQNISWTYNVVINNYLIPIIKLWIQEGSNDVPEWVLIKCIHAIGVIYRCSNNICAFCEVGKVVNLFKEVLSSNLPISNDIEAAIFIQLWNLSTIDFRLCYGVLTEWSSTRTDAAYDYEQQLEYFVLNLTFSLPYIIWKELILLAKNNCSFDECALKQERLIAGIKKSVKQRMNNSNQISKKKKNKRGKNKKKKQKLSKNKNSII